MGNRIIAVVSRYKDRLCTATSAFQKKKQHASMERPGLIPPLWLHAVNSPNAPLSFFFPLSVAFLDRVLYFSAHISHYSSCSARESG